MKYEFTALIEKKDLNSAIEEIHKEIEDLNGKVIEENVETNYKLAYRIGDIEECSRVDLDIELEGRKDCNKLSSKFNKNMMIMRYILCKAAK